MHRDLVGSDGLQETPHRCIKTIHFQIGNINNEGRFLYKNRQSGPWCGRPALESYNVVSTSEAIKTLILMYEKFRYHKVYKHGTFKRLFEQI